ncbi:MAG: CoB--CoM heterodisulfide reductase iron-sulfur subunit B family protein [Proteobacteria bacterium]|nr:CoB--CoM heterodisulfide reductase iron-sulfur subunit B family protein [Pseudomonadota bacterium]
MSYAYFPGCKIPHHLPAYGQAVTALCAALDIGLTPLEFNCCGEPLRHRSFEAWAQSAGRNLALAQQAGLAIMTPCKCCFGSLKHAAYWLRENRELRSLVASTLAEEGLVLPEEPQVLHLLTVLDRDLQPDELAARAGERLCGLRVAAHYGCHALRPGNVTNFDDPLNPSVFERLLRRVGAMPVPWALRLECCGHPLRGKRDKLSLALKARKLIDARDAGAHLLVTACTYCQMQFAQQDENQTSPPLDTAIAQQVTAPEARDTQAQGSPTVDANDDQPGARPWPSAATQLAEDQPQGAMPPAMLAAQLIGLGIGLSPEELGLTELPAPLVHPSSLGHEG